MMPAIGHYDDDSDDDFRGAYDDQDGYDDLGCYDGCVDHGVDDSYRYDAPYDCGQSHAILHKQEHSIIEEGAPSLLRGSVGHTIVKACARLPTIGICRTALNHSHHCQL